jgi:aminoglycoside phosphotransferase (APT) family kinase protein
MEKQDGVVAPSVRDLDVLAQQLTVWLSGRLDGAREVRVANLAYPVGAGLSHETILFDAAWTVDGRRHEQGLVARVKPGGHKVFPDDLFEEQFRVMQALGADGQVKVARTYWMETDEGVIGAPFFVMQKVQGRTPVTFPPYATHGFVAEATPARRRKLWENGVRQLAATQRVPLDGLNFLAGPGGLKGLDQEWEKWARFLAWMSEDRRWEPLDAAYEKLEASRPANQAPGLVWGDARLGNMMFDDDFDVVAVLDWEQPSLGGPLNDLTWWLYCAELVHGATAERPHLDGMGTREETIALWAELTGASTADVEWYEQFTRLKFAVMSTRMAQLGKAPAPTVERLRERLALVLD